MRARRTGAVLAAAALIALSACSPRVTQRVPGGYRSWSRSTNRELNYPVPGHLDNYRIIYVNEKARQWVTGTQGTRSSVTYPTGSMFVKEVYTGTGRPAEGATPTMLTVMLKAPDDPRAVRGWLFLTKDPASGKEAVVEQPFCADCHAASNDKHTYGEGNPDGELRDGVFIVPPRL